MNAYTSSSRDEEKSTSKFSVFTYVNKNYIFLGISLVITRKRLMKKMNVKFTKKSSNREIRWTEFFSWSRRKRLVLNMKICEKVNAIENLKKSSWSVEVHFPLTPELNSMKNRNSVRKFKKYARLCPFKM